MSEENVEIVRGAIAALNKRDVDGYLGLCAPDVELITPVAAIEGPSVGAQGIRQFFAGIDEAMTEFHLDVTELRALDGQRVLALGQVRSVSKGGFASTLPFVNTYEIRDAKLCRIRVYNDQDEGLRAAGLSG
jgi:ketosteroid isomerase-like protein